MKLVKYFDIHGKEVTPVVYTLFFALVKLHGNDSVYKESVASWNPACLDASAYKELNDAYQTRLQRGPNNTYYDSKAMKAFCKKPPTIKKAMLACWQWLKNQGITEEDEFFIVKLWW